MAIADILCPSCEGKGQNYMLRAQCRTCIGAGRIGLSSAQQEDLANVLAAEIRQTRHALADQIDAVIHSPANAYLPVQWRVGMSEAADLLRATEVVGQ